MLETPRFQPGIYTVKRFGFRSDIRVEDGGMHTGQDITLGTLPDPAGLSVMFTPLAAPLAEQRVWAVITMPGGGQFASTIEDVTGGSALGLLVPNDEGPFAGIRYGALVRSNNADWSRTSVLFDPGGASTSVMLGALRSRRAHA